MLHAVRAVLRRPAVRTVLLGLIGAGLAVQVFANRTFTIDAFSVRIAVSLLDGGRTVVAIPPFGSVTAHTHTGPVGLTLTLTGVDIQRLRGLVSGFTRTQLVPQLLADVRRDATLTGLWTLGLAVVGSAGLLLVAGERVARRLLAGASVGLAAVGILILLTVGSYRPAAFGEPSYSGALEAAPVVIALAQEGFSTLRNFEAQMGRIADNLNRLFAASRTLEPTVPAPGRVTVMLVSDIHNNPLAYDLIDRVLPSFHPAFILDSGDLTDLGTRLESAQLRRIAAYGVPYLFAPGNHESPAELAQLATVKNVIVLHGQAVVEDGVGIVGVADPASKHAKPQIASQAALAAAAATLRRDVGRARTPVSIAVGHEPEMVSDLFGHVPVVVNGHTHSIWIRRRGHSVWLNPGTTGAAGIRGIAPAVRQPGVAASTVYSLMLLYLDPAGGGRYRARAVDTIRWNQYTGVLDLQRQVFAQPAGG